MTNSLTIQIGNQAVVLTKSDRLVALPRSVTRPQSVDKSKSSEKSPLSDYVVLDELHAEGLERMNVYHTSDDLIPFVPTGTIYLEFEDETSRDSKATVIASHGLSVITTEENGPVTLGVKDRSDDPVPICARLQKERAVKIAEPDLVTAGELKQSSMTQFSLPADALLSTEWQLQNSGLINGKSDGLKFGADARVVDAWKILQGFGSPDVTIGIIDDGFDLTHPDLAGRARAPWDFLRNSSDVSPEANVNSPVTGNWHGTACAGVAIGAIGGGSLVGAAPECSWIPIRWKPDLNPQEVVKWFDYLREKGAWVISCSWGARARNYPLCTRLVRALSRCAQESRDGKGCIIVFAAGNENRDIDDPSNLSLNGFATHPDVIAVAASTSMDERADYSNFGKPICICAPSSGGGGRDITTSDVTGDFVDILGVTRPMGYVPGDYYEHFGKTSSACPLVAGICGLILSANPFLTGEKVREILKNTARRIGDPDEYDADGHSIYFGYGCVNAEAAVEEARALLPSV